MARNDLTAAGDRAPVTVIGLGAMGRALATTFVAAGHPTTVWNRTPGRAPSLEARGALVATSMAEAVAASPVAIICVLDRGAVESVLDFAGEAVAGATIVNLTSSTPEDARAVAARATSAGARYLDGKILVPTPLVGADDALFLYSGDRSVFDEHVATLRTVGPDADFLGEDHGLAALYDLAMLDVFFAGMAAFLHASALVGADGISAAAFLPYADRVTMVLPATMAGLADEVDRSEHSGEQDNLVMDGAAIAHIVEASTARGLDASLPGAVLDLVRAAIAAGHGRDGFSRIVDLLRNRRPAAA